MKWSRVKTILIILLLGVNIVFGINLTKMYTENRRTAKQAVYNAVEILKRRGIEVTAEDVPLTENEREIQTARNLEAEEQCAQNLLGQNEKQQLGGGMVFFKSDKGEILFRNGGFFEMELSAEDYHISSSSDARSYFKEILKDNNIKLNDRAIEVSNDENIYYVSTAQTAEKSKVYNGKISAVFGKDAVNVSGRWIEYEKRSGGERAKTAAELLLIFAAAQEDKRNTGITVAGIEKGYIISSQGNAAYLTPVWEIKYNDRTVYLNMMTGETAVFQQ